MSSCSLRRKRSFSWTASRSRSATAAALVARCCATRMSADRRESARAILRSSNDWNSTMAMRESANGVPRGRTGKINHSYFKHTFVRPARSCEKRRVGSRVEPVARGCGGSPPALPCNYGRRALQALREHSHVGVVVALRLLDGRLWTQGRIRDGRGRAARSG